MSKPRGSIFSHQTTTSYRCIGCGRAGAKYSNSSVVTLMVGLAASATTRSTRAHVPRCKGMRAMFFIGFVGDLWASILHSLRLRALGRGWHRRCRTLDRLRGMVASIAAGSGAFAVGKMERIT